MAGEYIVPLGIDGKTLLSGIDEVVVGIDKVATKAEQSGKTIEEAFNKGASAADKLDESIKPSTKTLEQVSEISKRTGKDLNDALNIKNASDSFSKDISDFRKKLADVTGKKTIGLAVDKSTIKDLQDATAYLKNNFSEIQGTFNNAAVLLNKNIDSAKAGIQDAESYIKDLEDSLKSIAPGAVQQEMVADLIAAKQALTEENAALAENEGKLAQIDAANKNLAKTLKDATTATEELEASQHGAADGLTDLGEGEAVVTERSVSLRTQLRNIKAELAALEIAGQGGSQQFFDLSVRAGELEDQIGDTNAQIRTLASDSKYLDATVSGVTGMVGAFTLAQGAVGLFGAENEELQAVLLKVNSAMAVLQGLQAVADTLNKDSAFSVIFLRNARVSDVAATEAQTVATTGQAVATTGATVATRLLGFALKALGIGLIIGLIAYLVENWDKLTNALNKLLPVGKSVGDLFNTIKSVAVGVGNTVLQFLITPFRALTALLTGNLEEFKKVIAEGFNFKKNYTDGFNKQETANEKAHQKELEEARITAEARDLVRRKNRGENVDALEIALQKRRLALEEKGTKAYTETLNTLEDLQDKHLKSQSDADKKAAEDAKKKRDEAAKKALEDRKKIDEQTMAYARSIQDIRIAAITNESERERAKIQEDYRRKLEDLKKDAALTNSTRQQQAELALALAADRDRQLADLEKETAKKQLELRLSANEALANLSKDGADRDLRLLQIDHQKRLAEINTQYKDEEGLRVMLVAALEQSTAREQKKIKDQAAIEALEKEEERQVLTIELASKYAKKNEQTERQKQIAILETKIEYANKAVDLMVAGGASENSLEVLRARKLIKDLQGALQDEIRANKGKGFDFLEFIGLGDLDDKQREALKKAGQEAGSALSSISDFIVDQYQRQIDKKQEVIDQIDNDISGLEDQLDEEKELREEGFANNVELIEADLAEKQRQKDEEIRQQEELVKKKQAMQRAQLAVDTAVQLVNMITASTEIFKSLAGIPFVGVPIAIGLIASMFGAFALSKVKAAQSINDSAKFGEGGWIDDGKSHAEGGKKYYSEDGAVRELERDEFVVKKRQARKFANILEAINSGNFSGLDINDSGLSEMLAHLGISFAETSSSKALNEARNMDAMSVTVVVNNNSSEQELREINENMRYLAQKERERKTSYEDDLYFYIQDGSKLTKIAKTKKPANADTEK